MKVYIIKTQNKIEPFLEGANELIVGGKSLRLLQEELFLELGLRVVNINHPAEIIDKDEHLLLEDDLYVGLELLSDFIKKSKILGVNTVCGVKLGIFTTRTIVSTQDLKFFDNYAEYPLFYFSKGGRKDVPKPVIFDLDENTESISLPSHMEDGCKYFIPATKKPIIRIKHWSNLWSANLASLLIKVALLKQSNKIKFIPLVLRSFSFNKWKILSHMNSIGKGCDIHPTAYIEGSTIGNNVIIGAGAIIKESIIGDDCYIGNGVVIELSVVGNNCSILNGHLMYSTFYPHVFSVTHMISASIVGSRSFVGSGVVLTDFRLDRKTITVMKENQKIDTQNVFLGCCLGHDVYLGGGCVVAPGRSIPNGLRFALSQDRVISKIDEKSGIEGFKIIK